MLAEFDWPDIRAYPRPRIVYIFSNDKTLGYLPLYLNT